MCQARCLASNALENVVDEGVLDSHDLGRDAGVQVDLLQHLVHVHRVALLVAALALLAVLLLGLGHSFFIFLFFLLFIYLFFGHSFFRALFRGRSRLSRFRHVYKDNTGSDQFINNSTEQLTFYLRARKPHSLITPTLLKYTKLLSFF